MKAKNTGAARSESFRFNLFFFLVIFLSSWGQILLFLKAHIMAEKNLTVKPSPTKTAEKRLSIPP
ncbi:MAG: hypothetical protein ACUVR0_10880 [Candidatus Aminicenantales bacterium]